MEVLRAEVMGLCFGVRDALRIIDRVERPTEVTIHGELVHNEVVLIDLENRGFGRTEEANRQGVPETSQVLITAHGISDRERERLRNAGRTLIDTTCPLVTRAHEAAVGLSREGYHVLLIGRRGHVEVLGIVEDLASYSLIETSADVTTYPHPRLGIVCQTTTSEALVAEIRARIAERNPSAEIRFIDTVCRPTKDHQRALEELLDRVEAVVVVGGKNSNNT
ncbi:MAG: 4-hydroxy-3-methylbut-2-enyl diphosphate reductase, partial [Isosphaeraceae bacterium]